MGTEAVQGTCVGELSESPQRAFLQCPRRPYAPIISVQIVVCPKHIHALSIYKQFSCLASSAHPPPHHLSRPDPLSRCQARHAGPSAARHTWRTAQGVSGALQLALQLPAVRGVDGRLELIHARHQLVHIRTRLAHRRAHLPAPQKHSSCQASHSLQSEGIGL